MTSLWFDDYRAAMLTMMAMDCECADDEMTERIESVAVSFADTMAEKRKELEPGHPSNEPRTCNEKPLPTPEEVANAVLNEHGGSLVRKEFTNGELWAIVESVVRTDRERRGV